MSTKPVFVCVLLLFMFLVLSPRMVAQSNNTSSECRPWIQHIDPSLGKASFVIQFPISEDDTYLAMQCFLQSEGNTNPSRIQINMSFNGGRALPEPSVEIAALYYISYLFEQDFQHSAGIALWDKHGQINPPGSVHIAYEAYRKWFDNVKRIGLEQARTQKLKPLAGNSIQWYGD